MPLFINKDVRIRVVDYKSISIMRDMNDKEVGI